MNNEIINEVRLHRTEILESFGWDIEKMMRAMMAQQGSKGHKVVALEKREPQGVAPNTYPLSGQT